MMGLSHHFEALYSPSACRRRAVSCVCSGEPPARDPSLDR